MPEIVSATPDHIRMLHDAALPYTVRALAVTDGDRVLGITGFYPENGYLVLFADISTAARAEIQRHKRTLILAARRILGMALRRRMPVLALADPDIDGADRLLLHLGFTPRASGGYLWTP